MEAKGIEELLATLRARLADTPETSTRGNVGFLNDCRRQGAIELLEQADASIQENSESAAWSYLVQAAEHVGYLIGIDQAKYLATPERAISAKLEQYGRKGGLKKGENAKQLQDIVARKLIDATPMNGWKSRPEVHRQFFVVAEKVPEFSASDYQWRELLKRPDIKKILPPPQKRAR